MEPVFYVLELENESMYPCQCSDGLRGIYDNSSIKEAIMQYKFRHVHGTYETKLEGVVLIITKYAMVDGKVIKQEYTPPTTKERLVDRAYCEEGACKPEDH